MSEPFRGPISKDEIVARITAFPLDGEPAAQRRTFARLTLGGEASATRASSLAPTGEPIEIPGRGGTVVYFHGGGYIFGSPQTHGRIGRGLAQRTGLTISMPAYPLAPEQPWPAQLDAARAAAAAVTGPLILAGDSAGGHLAIVTALDLARKGAKPAGLVVFSPNTDRTGLSRSRERNGAVDPVVSDAADSALARLCFRGMPDNDPQVSPLLDDVCLLPPTHIEVGADEVLRDDSVLLAERLAAVRGSASLHVDPDGLHMMQLWAPWWPCAVRSLDRAAEFMIRTTRQEPSQARSGRRRPRHRTESIVPSVKQALRATSSK